MIDKYQALIDALQALYPVEMGQLSWKSDERDRNLLLLANRAAKDGHIKRAEDSLMIYRRVEEKRSGTRDAEAHTATAAGSISQSVIGGMRWSKDVVKQELKRIIEDLRSLKRHSGETARDLWPKFIGKLDDAGLSPEEHTKSDFRKTYVKYGQSAQLTFGAFQKRLKVGKSSRTPKST